VMNVGYRALGATDPVQAARVPVHVLYPTHAAPTPQAFGPYAFDAARDGEIAGTDVPVAVISHGNGGTPWGYLRLALPLVRAGFVVVAVEHPGNSRADNSLANSPANLANRPRHLRVAIDALAADPALAPHARTDAVAAIGHSIGGYTVLAAAGGKPLAL